MDEQKEFEEAVDAVGDAFAHPIVVALNGPN